MQANINIELCELIKQAQGDRSQNQYALQCGVSSAALTRISSGTYAPSSKTLKKIAAKAQNGITYEMLLSAAGIYSNPQWTDKDRADGVADSAKIEVTAEELEWLELRSKLLNVKGEEYLKTLKSMVEAVIEQK